MGVAAGEMDLERKDRWLGRGGKCRELGDLSRVKTESEQIGPASEDTLDLCKGLIEVVLGTGGGAQRGAASQYAERGYRCLQTGRKLCQFIDIQRTFYSEVQALQSATSLLNTFPGNVTRTLQDQLLQGQKSVVKALDNVGKLVMVLGRRGEMQE
ncbi:hypothetical protein CALVIDRAFT_528435 [Calocera viscosa TUFC12733]|uniref:Uncharacterized protein n=1 Tax=Calocera viscosa (strain TUFC12733) TaxID=1330018 RepID=A0A167KWC6_CALVF|nr:hypothetical protein CALVIDRAFT_528435 [Calocera viscosa TUFC12733]